MGALTIRALLFGSILGTLPYTIYSTTDTTYHMRAPEFWKLPYRPPMSIAAGAQPGFPACCRLEPRMRPVASASETRSRSKSRSQGVHVPVPVWYIYIHIYICMYIYIFKISIYGRQRGLQCLNFVGLSRYYGGTWTCCEYAATTRDAEN